jgi:hypothetical protein
MALESGLWEQNPPPAPAQTSYQPGTVCRACWTVWGASDGLSTRAPFFTNSRGPGITLEHGPSYGNLLAPELLVDLRPAWSPHPLKSFSIWPMLDGNIVLSTSKGQGLPDCQVGLEPWPVDYRNPTRLPGEQLSRTLASRSSVVWACPGQEESRNWSLLCTWTEALRTSTGEGPG